MPSTPMGNESRVPVLSLESLSVRYGSGPGEVTVVRELTLAVSAGECLGVVGQSGAGKSQAFLAALGLEPPGARVSGVARLDNLTLTGASRAELDRVRGAEVAMVFQNPASTLTPHLTIGDQIAETLVRHRGCSWRAGRASALELLEQVRLDAPRQRVRQYPHELSGGMRQRAVIAMALACGPRLLIADEPTTALDVTVQAQILALLAALQRERAMAIVLITHDFGVVAGLAHRIAVMQAGRLVEIAAASRIFAAPEHPHTRALLAAAAVPGAPAADRLVAAAAAPTTVREVVLRLGGLTVDYPLRGWSRARRTLRAVDAVSLDLHAGEIMGLVGESGSGKSSLARAVLQLIRPTCGTVVWMGRALEALSRRELRALGGKLQIVFQDPLGSLDPRMTAAESVSEPLALHRPELDAAARACAVLAQLARVGLPAAAATRFPHQLSGGQCQRVGLARAMILAPRLLVCDEPVSALDVSLQAQIVALIAALQRESGTAILFVSHDLNVVRRICERVLVLYRGRSMELAPARALYERPLHPYTRALIDAVPIADPALQPARLRASLEREPARAASTAAGGCVFRERCPHALARCAESAPAWESAAEGRLVACHRWRELTPEGR